MSNASMTDQLKDLTVLVVDDHFPTRDMVKTILREFGFTKVLQADNGANALQRLEENEVDLVICDWNMPGTSGIELLRSLRKKDRYQNLPFLMVTAEVYKENVQEAIRLGVTDYIAKPFTAETLLQKIMATLK